MSYSARMSKAFALLLAACFATLGAAQNMAGMGAEVIDRLVLGQQLDRAVDAARHGRLPPQPPTPQATALRSNWMNAPLSQAP